VNTLCPCVDWYIYPSNTPPQSRQEDKEMRVVRDFGGFFAVRGSSTRGSRSGSGSGSRSRSGSGWQLSSGHSPN
jgi:hypothetical protein